MKEVVAPDEDGIVLLSRSDAAWVARVSTETIRRWVDVERAVSIVGLGRGAKVDWASLKDRLKQDGKSVAHWTWLNADLSRPYSTSPVDDRKRDEAPAQGEIEQLKAEARVLRAQRDAATADAENLDQAVMSYRDNWRRRVEPWSPGSLGGR